MKDVIAKLLRGEQEWKMRSPNCSEGSRNGKCDRQTAQREAGMENAITKLLRGEREWKMRSPNG